MELNYAIFRSQPINTTGDLAQIGSHNKREKKAYNSNPDINRELSKNNIELVPLADKYVKGFYNLVKDYKKEYEDNQKNVRDTRKKSFSKYINEARSVVADELLFTATNKFFDNMSKEDILKWANTCMDFVYNDLGYKKEQVLHSTIHMDEKTPHIHCVVVPLIKKFDKRTNNERYTISKKQFIKDKYHLSELQDKYHKRLTENGFDLERGILNSDAEHLPMKELKKVSRSLNNRLDKINSNIDNVLLEFDNQTKTNKNIPFDKKHIVVEKETFETMNKVIKETKKALDIQPKLELVFNEVNSYVNKQKRLERDNHNLKKEIDNLKDKNEQLQEENNNLLIFIKGILDRLKKFFRKLLQIGNDKTKEDTTEEIKYHYNIKNFDMIDVKDIARGTTKEDELFDYADVPYYYKENRHSKKDKEKDYDLSL